MKLTDKKDPPVASARGQKPNVRWVDVYSRLRDAIVSLRLAPGMKLPEDELASIYSVSRTAIRSALQALAHDRLVRLEPNRGAFVAHPSKQEAREIFDARMLIEPRVAALAAAAARRADIVRLRRHLEDAIIVQDLHAALAKLPRVQRDAIMLVGAEGMAYEEAAAALGVNVGTLKSRVNRARNRLAELMGLIGEDGVGSSRNSSS